MPVNYKRMMELAQERQVAIENYSSYDIASVQKYENLSDVVSAKIIEEWNMHGEEYQNNVALEFIREDGTSWGNLWYTQFVGPYYSSKLRDFISGTITLKDSSVIPLDSMSSQNIKHIMLGRKFRIKRIDWALKLRNRFNLLSVKEKISLIDEIRGRDVDEIRPFLDSGSIFYFMEI